MKQSLLNVSLLILVLFCVNSGYADDSCPSACKCDDWYVNCYNKRLKTIPDGIPSYTAKLNMGYNQINNISEGMFNGLSNPNLRVLYLYANQISNIIEGTFNGWSNLSELSLYQNQIGNITEGMFNGLSNLTSLQLGRNQINKISVGTFKGMGNLRYLYLGENRLTYISKGTFNGLSNLEYLYLHRNQISHFDKDTFQYLNKLKTLDLSGNKFTDLPAGLFRGLNNLKHLSIGPNINCSCNVGYIINNLKKQTNGTIRIYGTCDNGGNGKVDLQSFHLHETCSSVERTTERPFNVDVCPSKCSCHGSHEKFTVDCSKRGMTSIPRVPSYTERFWINHNYLSIIPQGIFNELKNLRLLVLGGNRFTYIPKEAFRSMNNLQSLTLTENKLATLPDGVFDGMDQLLQLSLQYNQITHLPDQIFKPLKNLQYLNLANNGLNILPNVYGLHNLVTFNLVDNPFTCSCYLFNQIHLLRRANPRLQIKGTCNGNVNLNSEIHKKRCDDHKSDHEYDRDDRFNKANNEIISKLLICSAVAVSYLL